MMGLINCKEIAILNRGEEEVTLPSIPKKMTNTGEKKKDKKKWLPTLVLDQTILFPGIIAPIPLKGNKELRLIEKAFDEDALMVLLSPKRKRPQLKLGDYNKVGTTMKVLKILHLPDGTNLAVVRGGHRVNVLGIKQNKNTIFTHIEELPETPLNLRKNRTQALIESIREVTMEIVHLMPQVHEDVIEILNTIKNPVFLLYYVATNVSSFEEKQKLLLIQSNEERARILLDFLIEALKVSRLKQQLQDKVHTDLVEERREAILRHQIRMLQNELGGNQEDVEMNQLKRKAKGKKWSKEVREHFDKVLKHLERIPPHAGEYSTYINYAHLLTDLPWGVRTRDSADLNEALKVLDGHHHGMKEVKDRLIEFLAVHLLKRTKKQGKRGDILCLCGPPGCGKTTIAKSIAEALGRKFVKISLGGVHDEAQIRGHRRTYVASCEGSIIAALKKAGSSNPVILLDEIDKVDPKRGCEAALLEVLDPSQNKHFKDHFLDVTFDLSDVLFITTANNEENISWPLADRMEFIYLSGYATEEKVAIGAQYIMPKQLDEHGLGQKAFRLSSKTWEKLITDYTSESGVRELERQIAKIARKVARATLSKEEYPKHIDPEQLHQFLGAPRYEEEQHDKTYAPGTSTGLAWTAAGGTLLRIETLLAKGEGKLVMSGQLGDVMEESATVAYTYLKAHAEDWGLDPSLFKQYDLHLHLAPGATSKDGPSAGITLLVAFVSLYTQRKVKPQYAMSGELTLGGRVLPVGGIKEKVLAAKRSGIKQIILSKKNEKDVKEIPANYINKVIFHYVDHIDDVLSLSLYRTKIKNPKRWDLSKRRARKLAVQVPPINP